MNARLYLYAKPDLGIVVRTQGNLGLWPDNVGYVLLSEPGDANGGVTIYLSRPQLFTLRDTINTALSNPGQEQPQARPKRSLWTWWQDVGVWWFATGAAALTALYVVLTLVDRL